MSPFGEASAGDRYRIEVTQGSFVKGLFSKKGKGTVSIVDSGGTVVWSRPAVSGIERRDLVDLIQSQVLSAPLESFEEWLRTEGASGRTSA